MKLFSNDLEGVYLSRPNRFILEASTPAGRVRAHCPNPGRMQELLLPGTPVILEKAAGWSAGRHRKTRYSLAACRYRDKIIPLDSSRANLAAEQLVLPLLFPEADTVRREVKFGASRFDFEVTADGLRHLVEVKACTLCEHGVAMFPDAPTLRGTRHVLELTESACAGYMPHIVFTVFHRDAGLFVPNIHTDPAFAEALEAAVAAGVRGHAVTIEADETGKARLLDPDLPVDTSAARLARENRGVYLLVLYTPGALIEVGKLGAINFRRGYYVYVGSAAKNLDQRVARHLRLRKKLRWHIDYLRAAAVSARAYPIRTRRNLECTLAAEIGTSSTVIAPGFGSSDCTCRSHLFYFREDPFSRREFVETLFRYRHLEAFASEDP